jgi:acyl-CoA thioester hydrolase
MILPSPPDGVLDGSRHLYAVRVYYEDTDLSGVTYHANYLRWFERARSDLLRLLKVDQRAAIEAGSTGKDGGAWAVAEMHLKYLRPARLDDDIVITTTCTELGAASCRMHQTARRGEETLCDANLRVGFISLEGRPRRQPRAWHEAFRNFMNEQG